MHAAVRPYVATGVALLGAGVIAVTPVAPAPPEIHVPEIHVGSWQVGLAAASLLNVPVNLVTDLVNVPYNEVQALNELSSSLLFSGPWFVASATNIWGVDPGDPGHFMSVIDLLVPFPALSGLGLGELNQNGLGQQVWQLAAAELPVNGYCAASGCPPNMPTSPITGITWVDQWLWDLASATGQLRFPLIDNFFKVPLSQLASGFTFGPNSPDYADPSGPAYPEFGFLGTTEVTGPNGPEYLMPWANTTFALDLSEPFQNFFTSLMADPSTNPIQLPDPVEVGRTLQALLAALVVAFDPTTAGSPLCAGDCSFLPAALNYPRIVQSIGNAWPGNSLIDEWLTAYDNNRANVPTAAQIQATVMALQQGFWDFGNPNPPPELTTGFNPSTLAPLFRNLWTTLDLNPPPLAVPAPATDPASSIALLQQKPLQGDVKLAFMPQGSHGQKSGGGVDTPTGVSVKDLRAVGNVSQPTLPQAGRGPDKPQPATGKDTQSTTTSTNPGQVRGNDTPRGGLAGARHGGRVHR